jgi:hypothetical protein
MQSDLYDEDGKCDFCGGKGKYVCHWCGHEQCHRCGTDAVGCRYKGLIRQRQETEFNPLQ